MARTIVRVNGGVRLCIDAQVPIPSVQKCTSPDGPILEQLFAYVRFDPEHVRFEPDPKQNEHFRTIMVVHGCT
jgi:hypothetical protein